MSLDHKKGLDLLNFYIHITHIRVLKSFEIFLIPRMTTLLLQSTNSDEAAARGNARKKSIRRQTIMFSSE